MRGGSVNFTYEYEAPVSNEDGDHECVLLDVTANISDYDPGCMYMRNGDPGYPPEGGEVDNVEVTLPDGSVMATIPDALYDALCGKAHDEHLN